MNWIQSMQRAIGYMEQNILEDLKPEEIAGEAYSSSANFQRMFHIVTGMTVGDYIRSRRLTLAGEELCRTKGKALDIALKYGYETAESFTKAFTRFHGVTPSAARKTGEGLKCFAPLSIELNIRGGFDMRRKMIPNIPELTYDGNNAAYFTKVLDAVLRGMGEPSDPARLTALSGEGNRFCWTEGAWVFGNECMESLNETPFETEARVLHALGWRAKYFQVLRDGEGRLLNTDRTQLRREFVEAIDRGIAVMPCWDHFQIGYTVFFGYEDDGEKMIGWDYQDNVTEPFAWEDWEEKIAGYIILQEKEENKTEREIALEALRHVVNHARRTTEIRGRKVGLAAWEAFLRQLEEDDFSGCGLLEADAPTVDHVAHSVEHRFFIYCDSLCQIYARKEALPYYRALAERFPEWRAELEAAAAALEECADYGGYLWSQGFTFDEEGYRKFRTPEGRKVLADAGRKAMEKDREAVELFERILEREGM